MPEYYEASIQHRICAAIIFDAGNFILYRDIVKSEYFENPALAAITQMVFDFYGKYERLPQADELLSLLDEHLNQNSRLPAAEYFKVFEQVIEIGVEASYDYARDKAIEFAKHEAMRTAIQESVGLMDRRNYQGIKTKVDDACRVGEHSMDLGVSYFERTDERLKEREEGINRWEMAIRPRRIFTRLTSAMNGGICLRELGVIMASMKRGKTATGVNFALGALEQNKNVAYLIMEGAEEGLELAFDACISGVPMDRDIKNYRAEIRGAVSAFLDSQRTGKLKIRRFPALTANAWSMESYLEQLRVMEGIKPDVLIIDYLGLMTCSDPKQFADDKYNQFGQIVKELMSLAQRRDYAIWLLHQSGRTAFKKRTVDMDDSGDSVIPMQHADMIITLNQTAEEEKKVPKEFRIFIAGHRHGPSRGTVTFSFDPECARLMEIEKAV